MDCGPDSSFGWLNSLISWISSIIHSMKSVSALWFVEFTFIPIDGWGFTPYACWWFVVCWWCESPEEKMSWHQGKTWFKPALSHFTNRKTTWYFGRRIYLVRSSKAISWLKTNIAGKWGFISSTIWFYWSLADFDHSHMVPWIFSNTRIDFHWVNPK